MPIEHNAPPLVNKKIQRGTNSQRLIYRLQCTEKGDRNPYIFCQNTRLHVLF